MLDEAILSNIIEYQKFLLQDLTKNEFARNNISASLGSCKIKSKLNLLLTFELAYSL